MARKKKASLNPLKKLEAASYRMRNVAETAMDTASKVRNLNPLEIPETAADAVKNAAGFAQKTAENAVGFARETTENAAGFAQETAENAAGFAQETAEKSADFAQETAGKAADVAGTAITKSRKALIDAVDENGNNEIDIEDIIIKSLKLPGIRINREDFLRKEFFKNHPRDVIDEIVTFNPAHAHISREEIDKIADEVIIYERNCVSGISTALGMAGGIAMTATVPADIIQYYGYMLRVAQKLLYLYGFPEIDTAEKSQRFDSETINILMICMGVMYGVAGANNTLKALAKALAKGVEKKLLRAALTKGSFYPIVKKIASWFGTRMTKQMFAGFFKNTIPVVGGVIGGGITFLSFKPCCDKLKDSLRNTMLANPDLVSADEEDEDFIIDIGPEERDEI